MNAGKDKRGSATHYEPQTPKSSTWAAGGCSAGVKRFDLPADFGECTFLSNHSSKTQWVNTSVRQTALKTNQRCWHTAAAATRCVSLITCAPCHAHAHSHAWRGVLRAVLSQSVGHVYSASYPREEEPRRSRCCQACEFLGPQRHATPPHAVAAPFFVPCDQYTQTCRS